QSNSRASKPSRARRTKSIANGYRANRSKESSYTGNDSRRLLPNSNVLRRRRRWRRHSATRCHHLYIAWTVRDVCDDNPGVPGEANRIFVARHDIRRRVGQCEKSVLQKIQSCLWAAESHRCRFSVLNTGTKPSSDDVATGGRCSE